MDADSVGAAGNISQGGSPIPDENQKQSSDTDVPEAGQLEPDAEVDQGMIDGDADADADVDLDAVG